MLQLASKELPGIRHVGFSQKQQMESGLFSSFSDTVVPLLTCLKDTLAKGHLSNKDRIFCRKYYECL